jgi:hypothetical protein
MEGRSAVGRALLVVAQSALAVVVGVLTVEVFGLFTARWSHPYDLEWMEGGMLVHAWRLLEGRPLYPTPDRDWIPYLYPAGYSSLVAFLAQYFGLTMGLGRLVSVVGTVSAALAMPYATWRLGRTAWPGLVGAGVFLSCLQFSGSFYDLVRLDALVVGLLAWSLALLIDGRRGTLMASALLLCAAYLVKHNFAAYGLPMMLAAWQRGGWRDGARFAAWSAVPALLVTAWMEVQTGGTYLTWLLVVPGSHGIVGRRIWPGVVEDYGHALPLAGPLAVGLLWASTQRQWVTRVASHRAWWALLAVAGAIGAASPWYSAVPSAKAPELAAGLVVVVGGALLGVALATRRVRPADWRYTLAIGVALVGAVVAAMMRGHIGGFVNVNMPVHWLASFGAALALGRPVDAARGRAPVLRPFVVSVLLLAQIQWGRSHIEFDRLVPTREDVEAGDEIVAALAELDPPVLSPFNPWLLVLAGHEEPGFHLIALWDIDRRDGPFPVSALEIRSSLKRGFWKYLIDGSPKPMGYSSDDGYQRGRNLPGSGGAFRPKSGYTARPSKIRPRRADGVPPPPEPAGQ